MAINVLVTGGAGALGSNIVRTLRTSGYTVISCGRVSDGKVDALWDVAQSDGPDRDCTPDVVVHAAALMGRYQQPLSESVQLFNVNVTGTLRVANWCVSNGVKRLVLVSGALIYGNWESSPKTEASPCLPWKAGPYAVSKICSEQVATLVLKENIGLSVLRLSSLYGTEYSSGLAQRLLAQGKETGEISLSAPFDDAFDLLHVSDAARTIGAAVKAEPTGTWNVGSGELTSILKLAELCSAQTGARLQLSDAKSDRPARILNWVNDAKARDELGHSNKITIDSAIAAIDASLTGTALQS